jgi:hypothetical protein
VSGRRRWVGRGLAALAVLVPALVPLEAQRGERSGRGRISEAEPNAVYDGRFTFARIMYDVGFGNTIMIGQQIPWSHDYPSGERNFTQMLRELSTVRARTTESVILALNDPELFRYPVAYMAEPGYWRPNDAEVAALRAYLLKGGFFIFDDLPSRQWGNLEQQMARVLPGARWVTLTVDHPIFDSFYRIASLDEMEGAYRGGTPRYMGLFEENDPAKRLMVIANYDNDISEYWEWAATGYFPIDLSNEAFKIGINYIVYALTR